jgi:hypothetical protein
VAVFIAPTKALVNQMAADVYRRYRERYGDVFGTYSPSYKRKVHTCSPRAGQRSSADLRLGAQVTECQVLITTADYFEPILLSSSPEIQASGDGSTPSCEAAPDICLPLCLQEWIKRIKVVIIDEVHTIGDEVQVRRCWNRGRPLLSLAGCPTMTARAPSGSV